MSKKQVEHALFDSRIGEAPENHPEPNALLDSVVENTEKVARVDGVVVGKLTGFNAAGLPLVDFYLNALSSPVQARAVLELTEAHAGHQVALMFEESDPRRPIIMGLMNNDSKGTFEIEADGQRRIIEAEGEILFRCGKSSILMKENGEIEISGRDIMSRASRNHKIRGGTIHLN